MSDNILIAVAGSQGIGKSTLINNINNVNKVSRKTSRSILKKWNVTLDEVNKNPLLSIKFQDEILKVKLEDDLVQFENEEIVTLTERTPVDLFVYALINMGKHNEYNDWVNDYFVRCKRACEHYDKVFFLTGNPSIYEGIEHDGVRSVNKHYSILVDKMMTYYYSCCFPKQKICYINDYKLDLRLQQVNDEMNHLKNTRK